ncbi:MAG: HPr(Ser) kinase/phosphatase [Gammaproteobacteria bacterium]|nr:HPr(Ser) kinase/phosphatase [Gammaproteobacteria bacterium]
MTDALTATSLYAALQKRLILDWVAGHDGGNKAIRSDSNTRKATAMAGYLNVIRPTQIQVIDEAECEYLRSLDEKRLNALLDIAFNEDTVIIIIAGEHSIPDSFKKLATERHTPLFTSARSGNEVLNNIRHHLFRTMADVVTVHGVFMEVNGIGVLITGESGIGKSELALELISRGHRLIADDAAEFARIAPDVLEGRCGAVHQDFLEVRGLGIINIRELYGDSAIKRVKFLRLIIHLEAQDPALAANFDRINGEHKIRDILHVGIAQMTLPVAPGRNLAVLVEAASKMHILSYRGYSASSDLVERQKALIQNKLKD